MAAAAADVKAILREAFGDSSSESDCEPSRGLRGGAGTSDSSGEIARPLSIFGDSHTWEQITEINGLWICRGFLSADQQSSLLSSLEQDGYLAEVSHNQHRDAMASKNKDEALFPSELLWREPLFNQLIVNIYQPGEGIHAHVDLMRFEDGIAIVSLESPCVMHFSPVDAESHCMKELKIPVLLTPGSLVLMWGEARYLWKHEINRKPGFQTWQGEEIDQKRRTSITLRRLCKAQEDN